MNYPILIFIGVVGAWVGYKLAMRRKIGLSTEQAEKKEENKKRVIEFFSCKKQITNNDVENLLDVSNATAERYLDELEKEGKLRQIGRTGRSVYYEK